MTNKRCCGAELPLVTTASELQHLTDEVKANLPLCNKIYQILIESEYV
jgi:hypothetical protein